MLCKYILIRYRNRALLSKSNSSNHSYQQQQTCKNQLVCMYSIQCNTKISNSRSSCPIMIPKRIIPCISYKFRIYIVSKLRSCRHWKSLKRAFRKRLPQSQNSSNNLTKTQNSSNRIRSSLMCKNFCGGNILKHHNKQKQNSKCSNINQLLQQNKIFKSLQHQKTRTMQKLQNQIKYRVHRVFRSHHLKNTHQCTSCYLSKRLTHLS